MSPTPARKDRLVQISPDQVWCEIPGCGKAAAFILHRYAEGPRPVTLAYCQDHVEQVALDLQLRIPGDLISRSTEIGRTSNHGDDNGKVPESNSSMARPVTDLWDLHHGHVSGFSPRYTDNRA